MSHSGTLMYIGIVSRFGTQMHSDNDKGSDTNRSQIASIVKVKIYRFDAEYLGQSLYTSTIVGVIYHYFE